MFTILLVIKKQTHDDVDNFERFMRLGMPTYEKYLDLKGVKEFIVVTPADEQKTFADTLQAKWPSWPWRFIGEDKLLDKTMPEGWSRQQTAKLAVSMLVTTDHYLIIDDDTYLTRPFGYANLFDANDSGKVIMNRTLIDFPFFFLWSNQVLRYDMELVQKEPWHMAITPEIFVTSEVRGLVKWLVATYGDNKQWQKYLADHKYTEYCLYWIWLIKNDGKHKQLYSTAETAVSVYGHATTSEDQDLADTIRKSFDPSAAHYFSFVQSSLHYPLERLESEISKNMI